MPRRLRIALIIIVIIIIFAIAGSVASKQLRVSGEKASLVVGDYTMTLDIADEWSERVRGLSGREKLPEDSGLLFVFEEAGYHGIWMKNMNFPIDIVWLSDVVGENDQMQVVDIKRHILPATFPTTFHPSKPASFVIEMAAGVSEKIGLEVGDALEISFE